MSSSDQEYCRFTTCATTTALQLTPTHSHVLPPLWAGQKSVQLPSACSYTALVIPAILFGLVLGGLDLDQSSVVVAQTCTTQPEFSQVNTDKLVLTYRSILI